MKLLLLIVCLLLVACSYDGSGTQCEKYSLWSYRAECYRDYSKRLEMELEILNVKMEYGCKELKEGK
ncbi:MAG: hypothetical protein MJZ34_15375 [Paludibacteraceae bacterium]|nr:hypothetical protein [Paludibacteraceae bacterium]